MSCDTTDGAGVPGGGGDGKSGGVEGADPTAPLADWTATCASTGTVPVGTNGTDAETWAE